MNDFYNKTKKKRQMNSHTVPHLAFKCSKATHKKANESKSLI